jgi:putative phosphoribosyl transferase
MSLFRDRVAAGRALARALDHYADARDALVLALPRGGVPVAFEVAQALHLPLDVFVVRKIGMPGNEELALGALAAGAPPVLNEELVQMLGVTPAAIAAATDKERGEVARRERAYRDELPPPVLKDRVLIVVDDGLATGATMRAAVRALRQQAPARIVVAVPVCSREARAELSAEADEMVCLEAPESFYAVSVWYDEFPQTSDEEVRSLFARASSRAGAKGGQRKGGAPTMI